MSIVPHYVMRSKADLHPYQREAVQHIFTHPRSGLFLDMGLGKTATCLTAVKELIDTFCISRVLVIAPLRVARYTWTAEIAEWEHLSSLRAVRILGSPQARRKALAADADIYITNRENVAWLVEECEGKLPFDCVIIDELSSFKNPSAQRFKRLKRAIAFVPWVIGLTGTPAPNGLMDLWAELFLLDQGARLGKTITAYRARYFYPGKRRGMVVYEYLPKTGAEAAIHSAISDICLSMRKEDLLSLPPLVVERIPVTLPKETLNKYHRLAKEKVAMLDGNLITALNAVSLSGKLLQMAGGAIYEEGTELAPSATRPFISIHNEKIEELKERVDAIQGNVIVAYNYLHERTRIMEALAAYNPREINSEADINDWNAGSVKVLIGHPQSIGHGLNLQRGGNHIIFFSPTWNLELYQQFVARLWRQGQTEKVFVYILVAQGTIDERVCSAIKRKEATQNDLIDALKRIVAEYNQPKE